MTDVQIPDYTTDKFFGLEDKWLQTAPGELTHYHELGEGTPPSFSCTAQARALLLLLTGG